MKDSKPASYYECERPEIARLIKGEPHRILEVGCGCGNFKNNVGWSCEYHGVEPVASAAEKAEANGIVVHKGLYDEVKDTLPEGYFDLVVANDVMEHMQDPWDFLRSIRGKLREGGTLVGSVPNVRYLLNLCNLLFRRDWKYMQAGVLDATHLRFFTVKSAARMLQESGFDTDKIHPSGPDKYVLAKKIMASAFLLVGTDTLYAQIAFRAHVRR